MANEANDGRCDFDFFMGEWNIHHRRLRERLKGSTDWEEFSGKCAARKILCGIGNFDEISMERESGTVCGATMRLFNPVTKQWSIHWASSLTGTLETPMIGEFKDGRGEFYSQELFEGRAIFNRFIWTVINENACRWQQAFSADGGKIWETNWIMDFTRQP